MLRWLLACVLVAQTLAHARPDRHASWPKWMRMPQVDWPEWMPTQEDLPDVTIPEIQMPKMPEMPTIDMPDINLQMPGAVTDMFGRSRWNPSAGQDQGGARGPTQSKPRKGGGYDISIGQPSTMQQSRRTPDRRRKQRPSSSSQGGQQRQPSYHNMQGSPDRRRYPDMQERPTEQPTTGSPIIQVRPDQSMQWQGWGRPSSGRGNQENPWQWPSSGRNNQGNPWQRPSSGRNNQENPWQWPSSGRDNQENPQQWPSSGRNNQENPWQWPSSGRNNQERPQTNWRGSYQSGSRQQPEVPSKPRKGSRQTGEGPPQRDEPVRQPRPDHSTNMRIVTKQRRSEPSVGQQLERFRLGMPQTLRDELNSTFTSMKEKLEEGRLQLDSWADDISTAAEEWWNRWNRGNAKQRPQSYGRPGESRGRPNGRPDYGHPGRGRGNSRGHGNRGNGRGYGNQGRGHQTSNGWGHQTSNGRGHTISNGRGHDSGGNRKWYNKWFEGRQENGTGCRGRPFHPVFEGPEREEPGYTVLCGGNDYEARLYNASVWVTVNVSALTYDLAVHKAYTKLYRYISGHNNEGVEVTRTLPLRTKVQAISRGHRWFERYHYQVSFYLPEDVQANPPAPLDSDLELRFEDAKVYYAHAFRGYALEFNIWEYADELTNTLDLNEEPHLTEEYIVNVYDAPWRFFNRRNDIMVFMDTTAISEPMCSGPAPTDLPTELTTIVQTVTVTEEPAVTTDVMSTADVTSDLPTILPDIPLEIKLPEVKNPFDNNELDQGDGIDCEAGDECPAYVTGAEYDGFEQRQYAYYQGDGIDCEAGDECPAYVRGAEYDGFEQRQYAYSRWICLDQSACDFDQAQWLSQGSLIEYFYPKGNREQTTMRLTTPLVIGMDVADLFTRSDCDVTYTACMFIPNEHQSAPPTPRDARLYLQDIPAMSRYVQTFGGRATSQNVPKLGAEFISTLDAAQVQYDSSIVAVAQYTTSKLEKKRTNEFWVMDQSLIQAEVGLQ